MRTATELLTRYAEYHRDRRNIVSHFVGVPMIVFGAGVLLARPSVPVSGVPLTPAWAAFAVAAAWYLTRGNVFLPQPGLYQRSAKALVHPRCLLCVRTP